MQNVYDSRDSDVMYVPVTERTLMPHHLAQIKSPTLAHKSSNGKAICKFSAYYWVAGQHMPVGVSIRLCIRNTGCINSII